MKTSKTEIVMSDDIYEILKEFIDLPQKPSEITIVLKAKTPVVVTSTATATKEKPFSSFCE